MVLVVGDRIDFTYYHLRLKKWTSIQGPIVKIIHQGETPSQAEMEVLYKLKPGDKHYGANCQPALWDRLVIVKESDGFLLYLRLQ